MKQEIRDRAGVLIGWLEQSGRLINGRDRSGSIVGSFDPASNETRDRAGVLIGTGNHLVRLM